MLSVEDKPTYGKLIKARVPEALAAELKDFCKVRGFKVQEFVRNAIESEMLKERRAK